MNLSAFLFVKWEILIFFEVFYEFRNISQFYFTIFNEDASFILHKLFGDINIDY